MAYIIVALQNRNEDPRILRPLQFSGKEISFLKITQPYVGFFFPAENFIEFVSYRFVLDIFVRRFLQNHSNYNLKSGKCVLWLRPEYKNSHSIFISYVYQCSWKHGLFYLQQIIPVLAPGIISLFEDSDIEKTVVIPGYSSFLITSIIDANNALAIATMPGRVPDKMTFLKDSWFLYNFGQRNGRTWNIYARPCNYYFQQHDDSLSLNVLKYIDLGKSHAFKVKVIHNTKGKFVCFLLGNIERRCYCLS